MTIVIDPFTIGLFAVPASMFTGVVAVFARARKKDLATDPLLGPLAVFSGLGALPIAMILVVIAFGSTTFSQGRVQALSEVLAGGQDVRVVGPDQIAVGPKDASQVYTCSSVLPSKDDFFDAHDFGTFVLMATVHEAAREWVAEQLDDFECSPPTALRPSTTDNRKD